jgi:hypothetical protein
MLEFAPRRAAGMPGSYAPPAWTLPSNVSTSWPTSANTSTSMLFTSNTQAAFDVTGLFPVFQSTPVINSCRMWLPACRDNMVYNSSSVAMEALSASQGGVGAWMQFGDQSWLLFLSNGLGDQTTQMTADGIDLTTRQHVYMFNPTTGALAAVRLESPGPLPRVYQVGGALGQKLYVFNGDDVLGFATDSVWSLDLSGCVLLSSLSSDPLDPAVMAAAAATGSTCGGWTHESTWAARDSPAFTFMDTQSFLFGGWILGGVNNDVWRSDSLDDAVPGKNATLTMHQLMKGAFNPRARSGHSVVAIGSNLFVYGVSFERNLCCLLVPICACSSTDVFVWSDCPLLSGQATYRGHQYWL